MAWIGNNIKLLSKERGLTLTSLAEKVGVSRQSINDWIKGQIPKGNHLRALCKALQISPEHFFSNEVEKSITVPAHRARMSAKVTPAMQADAISLAKEYELLFRNIPISEVVPVLRTENRNSTSALRIAMELRQLVNVNHDRPMNYEDTFKLLERLGIIVIFRYFPQNIKSYAFYNKINDHRIVFVNNNTNVLDLIFPLLHEAVHAIRDEVFKGELYDKEEEAFCDLVANFVQFPDEYIQFVYSTVSELTAPMQVQHLKMFGKKHGHSLFGIVKQMQVIDPSYKLNVGGANTNLKKQFPTIGDILFSSPDPRNFVKILSTLSSKFIHIVLDQIENISIRKLSEMLGLDSSLDAKVVKSELLSL